MEVWRDRQLDTAKGILMTLVIFGHVLLASDGLDIVGSLLLKLIYSFHMPAFLIISGFLFDCEKQRKRNFPDCLCSKFIHILVPYFLFELLGGIVRKVFAYGEPETIKTILRNIVTFNMYVGADWYLLTYLLAIFAVFLINKISHLEKTLPVTALISFAVVCFCRYGGTGKSQVFMLRILLAYSLIVVGILLKKALMVFNWRYFFVAFIGLTCAVTLNSNVFMHAVMIGNPLLFLLGGISGTYLVLQVAAKANSSLLNTLGRYSIVPMGIHQNVIWIFGWFFGLSGKWSVVILDFMIAYSVAVAVTMVYKMAVGKERV